MATFREVTKYLRERKSAQIQTELRDDAIAVTITSDLDAEVYNVPMTVKTYVPSGWKSANLSKGEASESLAILKDEKGSYVLYSLKLGEGEVILEEEG